MKESQLQTIRRGTQPLEVKVAEEETRYSQKKSRAGEKVFLSLGALAGYGIGGVSGAGVGLASTAFALAVKHAYDRSTAALIADRRYTLALVIGVAVAAGSYILER